MTKGLHSFMFEAGSLQTMANSFQSKMGFKHTADILFVHFKLMFLSCGIVADMIFPNTVCTLCFSNKKKRETCAW